MPPHFAASHWISWLPSQIILVDTILFFPSLSYRVRSLIIQQEKAQDREKLLLKFIKIMKVSQNLRLGPTCHVICFNAVTFKQIIILFITALKEVE